jgi:hypothetical protein
LAPGFASESVLGFVMEEEELLLDFVEEVAQESVLEFVVELVLDFVEEVEEERSFAPYDRRFPISRPLHRFSQNFLVLSYRKYVH